MNERPFSETTARVLAADADWLWLQPGIKSGCASCSATDNCGTAALSKTIGGKPPRLKVANTIDARAGDLVVLALPESKVLQAAALTYLLPIGALIVGILSAMGMGAGDLAAGFVGLLALVCALALVRKKFGSAEGGFTPQVLRLPPAPPSDMKENGP